MSFWARITPARITISAPVTEQADRHTCTRAAFRALLPIRVRRGRRKRHGASIPLGGYMPVGTAVQGDVLTLSSMNGSRPQPPQRSSRRSPAGSAI